MWRTRSRPVGTQCMLYLVLTNMASSYKCVDIENFMLLFKFWRKGGLVAIFHLFQRRNMFRIGLIISFLKEKYYYKISCLRFQNTITLFIHKNSRSLQEHKEKLKNNFIIFLKKRLLKYYKNTEIISKQMKIDQQTM